MEVLAKTEVVVFDKTGTLTKGVFNVTVIHPDKISQSQLLELAAIAESYSEHPVARSIREAYGQEIDMSRLSDVHELSGRGVCAVIDGRKICVGNDKLMEENGVTSLGACCLPIMPGCPSNCLMQRELRLSALPKAQRRFFIKSVFKKTEKLTVCILKFLMKYTNSGIVNICVVREIESLVKIFSFFLWKCRSMYACSVYRP